MDQTYINFLLIIIFLGMFIVTLDLHVRRLSPTVKELRYNPVKSSGCASVLAMMSSAPDKFFLLMEALNTMFNVYKEEAKTKTCMVCKNKDDPRCNDEAIARWVFANCP